MRKEKTALQRINWRSCLWLPALIFLSNPNFHALDLLPDFVGYLLLLAALRRVSALDESFFEASRAFRRMAWLSAARLIALIWVFSGPSANEQPTLLLLISFAIGVLELITILPACTQLFRGLSYLATRLDGTVVFESVHARRIAQLRARMERLERRGELSAERRQRMDRKLRRLGRRYGGDITDRACFACQSFAVLKTVLCVLPELATLSYGGYDVGAVRFNWYAYINGFRAMAFFVGVIVGIVWLCRLCSYCRCIASDVLLWEHLEQKIIEDERTHPSRVPARHLRHALVWITIACVFCINFHIDGINVLPSVLTPLCLLIALFELRPYLPRAIKLICGVIFGANTAMSVLAYLSQLGFFKEFYLSEYHRNWNVRAAYTEQVLTPSVMEAAFTLATLTALALIVCVLVDRYTGSHGAGTYQYTKEELARIRRSQLKRHMLLPLMLGVLTAISHVVYYYLLPEYEMIWLLDVLIALAFAVLAPWRLWDLREDLDVDLMLPMEK